MMNKKIIADQLLAYLQHRQSAEELVNWAEEQLVETYYDDDEAHTIRNILAQLALADVKAFGLEYQDCELIMQKLGYTLEVKALSVA